MNYFLSKSHFERHTVRSVRVGLDVSMLSSNFHAEIYLCIFCYNFVVVAIFNTHARRVFVLTLRITRATDGFFGTCSS